MPSQLDLLIIPLYNSLVARRVEFTSDRPKPILNKGNRADHWFCSRYSAYPYKGCMHGCEFRYCREENYYPYDGPRDFACCIQVKENAPKLLRRALSRAPVDLVMTGGYQPAERKFEVSRKMLQFCLELSFPGPVVERSPLVLRDLELRQDNYDRATSKANHAR